jgi:hypothetical protein
MMGAMTAPNTTTLSGSGIMLKRLKTSDKLSGSRSGDMWKRLIASPKDKVIEQLIANHPALTREQAAADLEMAGF